MTRIRNEAIKVIPAPFLKNPQKKKILYDPVHPNTSSYDNIAEKFRDMAVTGNKPPPPASNRSMPAKRPSYLPSYFFAYIYFKKNCKKT
jgi:hypothetical protein